MKRQVKSFGCVLFLVMFLSACGAGTGANQGSTLPAGAVDISDLVSRFEQLEGSSTEIDPNLVAGLPEVADQEQLLLLESTMPSPDYSAENDGYELVPPEDWTIGTTEEGEEVRIEFLEASGSIIVAVCESEAELEEESTIVWIVRYDRRNVLLTESGMSVSVHVVPIAAMLLYSERDSCVWISNEAGM